MKRLSFQVCRPYYYPAFVSVFLFWIIFYGCIADASHHKKNGDESAPANLNHGIKQNKGKGLAQPSPVCSGEDKECEKDRQGLEAIKTLHLLIDDDHNGNVDQSESDEFLRDELQYTDGFERQALFHNNDKLISVDDLWGAWKYSVVYNWTVDDVIEWLVQDVGLPQYTQAFHHHSIDGSYLPRLVNSTGTLIAMLGVRKPVHKQKLSLKAMDTVLFGAPKRVHSYIKDILLVSSLIITFGGALFTYLQHRYSKTQYNKMLKDLESLQKAEEALKVLSNELSEAEKNQKSISPEKQEELMLLRKNFVRLKIPNGPRVGGDTSPTNSLSRDGSLIRRQEGEKKLKQAEEEINSLREALCEAENKLEVQQQLEPQWGYPGELQAWLQMTHELEVQHYNAKRQAAERQLMSARDGCDKIKKRNKAFFGSLRMAHSNSMDEIDQTLLDARSALEEVKQDLQERLTRWGAMESLCGFPIITNPGLSNLRQMLGCETPNGSISRNIPGSLLAPVSIDEADEDLPPVAFLNSLHNGALGSHRPRALSTGYPNLAPAAPKSYLKQTLTGSTISLSHTGKAPCQGPPALVKRESQENVLQSSVHAAPNSSAVSFHLGEGAQAQHERSHSNASSSHYPPVALTNGHPSHHQYQYQGQGHGHPNTRQTVYNQSHSFPPMKQSSIATLQAPGSSHLSATSSVGTMSKIGSSQGGSFVNLRPGLSTSNSNIATTPNQKVYHHNYEDQQAEANVIATPGSSNMQWSPQLPLSLPFASTPNNRGCVNESWELESTDSLSQQPSLSSDRPNLLRTPEFDETTSIESASLQSASAHADKMDKKGSRKKKFLKTIFKKSSTKQKTA